MCGPKNFKGSDVILSTNVHRCTYLSRSLFVTLTTTVDNRLTHFKTRAAKGLARVTSKSDTHYGVLSLGFITHFRLYFLISAHICLLLPFPFDFNFRISSRLRLTCFRLRFMFSTSTLMFLTSIHMFSTSNFLFSTSIFIYYSTSNSKYSTSTAKTFDFE